VSNTTILIRNEFFDLCVLALAWRQLRAVLELDIAAISKFTGKFGWIFEKIFGNVKVLKMSSLGDQKPDFGR
jgi:hypothetical protein